VRQESLVSAQLIRALLVARELMVYMIKPLAQCARIALLEKAQQMRAPELQTVAV
jgi:hypothetical protein